MEQYIVSARKYRPATFDAVVGQRALTTTLLNAIRTGKLAHAYLFCGPRGVGKTTCARIFAKTINCEHLNDNGEACNECESCRAFDEQRSLNIHEMDAASNNSVDDIRDLIEQVRIPPQIGRYKVFIIDEVHMLSSQAFNAFLKTLEEPPKYVIFILATTEKNKILPTILSRCQVYDFARITLQSTIDHLRYVAEKEGYNVEEEALSLIAQKADGGMRDALSIFDQMVSYTGGNITYSATLENLNILDAEYYFRIVENVLNQDIESSLLLLNEITEKGFDGGNFINGLASHLRNLLVSRDAKTLSLLETTENQRKRYHEQAMRCRPKFLYRAIKLCNDCDLGYRQSRNKRLQVEICLIEMTQAIADDGESAGHGPAKIIKPIFKHISSDVAQSTTSNERTVKESQQQSVLPKTKIIPKPKEKSKETPLRQLSIKSLSIKTSSREKDIQATTEENVSQQKIETGTPPLTQDSLILQWQICANNLPQAEVVTAQRMRSITPKLLTDESFSITVGNPLIEKAMEKIRPSIETHLRKIFGKQNLKMEVIVSEMGTATVTYSKPEQLKKMMQDNPALAQLADAFKLEIV